MNNAAPQVPTMVRVLERQSHSADVFSLTLDLPRPGWTFAPGQFNMLYAFGVGEAAISLCGDPTDAGVRHTIRAVGSVTNALSGLQPGGSVGLRGPYGSAWPLAAARGADVVLVAGGLGLPPLRPTIYHLLRQRQDYGRIALLYGSRTPADVLYAAELEQWRRRGDFQVLATVDRGDAAWPGAVGMVTALFAQLRLDPLRTVGLMCGPEVMMRFAVREFQARGVGDDRLYLSLERNMQCAVGFCGHCQFGPSFVCMDGPVFRYDRIQRFLNTPEA